MSVCKYCEPSYYKSYSAKEMILSHEPFFSGMIVGLTRDDTVLDMYLLGISTDSENEKIEINYCPMCGRKFEKGIEVNEPEDERGVSNE